MSDQTQNSHVWLQEPATESCSDLQGGTPVLVLGPGSRSETVLRWSRTRFKPRQRFYRIKTMFISKPSVPTKQLLWTEGFPQVLISSLTALGLFTSRITPPNRCCACLLTPKPTSAAVKHNHQGVSHNLQNRNHCVTLSSAVHRLPAGTWLLWPNTWADRNTTDNHWGERCSF